MENWEFLCQLYTFYYFNFNTFIGKLSENTEKYVDYHYPTTQR